MIHFPLQITVSPEDTAAVSPLRGGEMDGISCRIQLFEDLLGLTSTIHIEDGRIAE